MSRIEKAIRSANDDGRLALAGFVTAGFPTKRGFSDIVAAIAPSIDVLEIGVPFSDPMADGISIQHASQEALKQGVTLEWILNVVRGAELSVPVVLMSYLNPLLAFGLSELASSSATSGISGFIVPDLPYEEAGPLHDELRGHEIDLIQLVTPATPPNRLATVSQFSRGFVYAVTKTGTTGGEVVSSRDTFEYLARVRQVASCPVLAGFGIRKPQQITELAGHADGVIVGSAITEILRRGDDAAEFIKQLRAATSEKNEVVR